MGDNILEKKMMPVYCDNGWSYHSITIPPNQDED
jgi:hypothetical protein